jgi:hypothetical protein
MSRALGAAFLSHQVEQLEKSVTRGPASGNWRDRRQPQVDLGANPNRRSTTVAHGAKPRPASGQKQTKKEYPDRERDQPEQRHKEKEKPRKMSVSVADKDADLVIVDASVLVHALYQVKKWCRDGREEIVIIPLEGRSLLPHMGLPLTALAQRSIHWIFSRRARVLLPREPALLPGFSKHRLEQIPASESSGMTLLYRGTESSSETPPQTTIRRKPLLTPFIYPDPQSGSEE